MPARFTPAQVALAIAGGFGIGYLLLRGSRAGAVEAPLVPGGPAPVGRRGVEASVPLPAAPLQRPIPATVDAMGPATRADFERVLRAQLALLGYPGADLGTALGRFEADRRLARPPGETYGAYLARVAAKVDEAVRRQLGLPSGR